MSGRFFHSSELGAVIVVVVAVVDKAVVARELFDHAVRRGEEQHDERDEVLCAGFSPFLLQVWMKKVFLCSISMEI